MPLSFLWDDEHPPPLDRGRTTPPLATWRTNPALQLTLGHTRDVVHITGHRRNPATPATSPTPKATPSPRRPASTRSPLASYLFFRATPTKIQAWREVNELKDRVLMDSGAWLI